MGQTSALSCERSQQSDVHPRQPGLCTYLIRSYEGSSDKRDYRLGQRS
jgi:hypothetical protein